MTLNWGLFIVSIDSVSGIIFYDFVANSVMSKLKGTLQQYNINKLSYKNQKWKRGKGKGNSIFLFLS